MEFIHRMTLDEMQRKYGNNCQFIVIDVNRFGFVPPPRPGITTGTQSETVSDVASMQDYYAKKEHSENDFDVVVLEEEDGVFIYSGAGTVNDSIVVEYV